MFYPYPLESKKQQSKRTKKLFNRFLKHVDHNRTFNYKQWKNWLDGDALEGNDYVHNWKVRESYVPRYGFAVITTEVVSRLATFMRGKRVLDSGAGAGYLSNCLRNRGIKVTAIDNWSHSYASWGSFRKVSSNVIDCDVSDHDVAQYDVIILSWPHDGMETLNKMVSGQYLIYQGESAYGATGSEDFFATLEDSDQFEEIDAGFLNEYALRFDGIHDYWNIYKKK